jgi:hypothetical protein
MHLIVIDQGSLKNVSLFLVFFYFTCLSMEDGSCKYVSSTRIEFHRKINETLLGVGTVFYRTQQHTVQSNTSAFFEQVYRCLACLLRNIVFFYVGTLDRSRNATGPSAVRRFEMNKILQLPHLYLSSFMAEFLRILSARERQYQ